MVYPRKGGFYFFGIMKTEKEILERIQFINYDLETSAKLSYKESEREEWEKEKSLLQKERQVLEWVLTA